MLSTVSMSQTTVLLLGSAAVGALVSSIITLIGQQIERKARREELLLTESVKLALAHNEQIFKVAQASSREAFMPAPARLAHTYFVALKSLMSTGQLPKGLFTDDGEDAIREFQEKHRHW